MDIVTLIIVIVVLIAVWILATKYLVPLLPEPWGKVAMIIIVLVAIFILLGFIGVVPGFRLR